MDRENWYKAQQYTPEMLEQAKQVLEEVRRGADVQKALRRHPLPAGGYLAKHVLVAAYRQLTESGEWTSEPGLLERIRMKPVRTLSGVTTVTVLTKPYPCPGKCIFCPTDVRMPKSYLPDEPGARRGLEHDFDPYAQVASRLEALASRRAPDRQDRAAHPGRHVVRLPPGLPGMVRPALLRRDERGGSGQPGRSPGAAMKPPSTATWAW